MWSESTSIAMPADFFACSHSSRRFSEAQIRLVNYCCTLLHKSVLDDDSEQKEMNHLVYAERNFIVHSLGHAILTFLSVVRCRKEIGTFYRENEHFRELLSAMRHKYGPRSEFMVRDPSIAHGLGQVSSVMFDRHQRRKRRHHHYHQQQPQPSDGFRRHQRHDQAPVDDDDTDENRLYRKCSNSLCHMIENHVSRLTCHECVSRSSSDFRSKFSSRHALIARQSRTAVSTAVRFTGQSIIICRVDRSLTMAREKIPSF